MRFENCAAHDPMVATRDFHVYEYACLACHREQEIRREERECVIELIKCCHGIGSCLNEASLIVKIRALPEREAASRKESK